MKSLLILSLIMISSLAAASECYQGIAKDGSINGIKHDAILVFQRSSNAGGRAFLAAVDKSGSVTGETRCGGGAPDQCSFGTDGGPGKFQFLQNVPTVVIDNGKLRIISGDGDERDLRAPSKKEGPGFNYPMAVADQKVCAALFPQEKETHGHPDKSQPAPVSVPTIR